MSSSGPKIALENGLDLRQLTSTGIELHINENYEDDLETELEDGDLCFSRKNKRELGEPVVCIEEFAKQLKPLDGNEIIRKKILENGGGLPLNEEYTVTVAFTGYWENEPEPFFFTKPDKPMVVNLKDNGLLPAVQMAIESMLVGETAVFLLPYQLMYGELGVPPRIKPKADCIFYAQLIKSVITPKDGKIDYREPNIFERVKRQVKYFYSSGVALSKSKNHMIAIKLFKRGVNMLYRCRLADQNEEDVQLKLLIKLYINLAICYNETRQPLKACTACNELHRLKNLWNNAKVLFQNAKALRMICEFDEAEKKLKRALKLSPDNKEILNEIALVNRLKDSCNRTRLVENKVQGSVPNKINENFKNEVDSLIKSFKENVYLTKLTLPANLNEAEMEYVKEACDRENLACNRLQNDYLLDKEEEMVETNAELFR